MNFSIIRFIILCLFLFSCEISTNSVNKLDIKIGKKYNNSGFALIYNDKLSVKELESRSLDIYHKSLKKNSIVKITNPVNKKYLIAKVKSNKIKFSNFYNSIISSRIVNDLELDIVEPFVEIVLISKDSTFVAKKAKMFHWKNKRLFQFIACFAFLHKDFH